jgi:hypothetical protein
LPIACVSAACRCARVRGSLELRGGDGDELRAEARGELPGLGTSAAHNPGISAGVTPRLGYRCTALAGNHDCLHRLSTESHV